MKIGELERGMNNVSLEGKVVDVGERREVQTRFGKRNVAEAIIEDDSGQIALTLWEEKINSVAIGDTVKVEGAFVTEFKNKLQLNIPRSGKMEIVKE